LCKSNNKSDIRLLQELIGANKGNQPADRLIAPAAAPGTALGATTAGVAALTNGVLIDAPTPFEHCRERVFLDLILLVSQLLQLLQ